MALPVPRSRRLNPYTFWTIKRSYRKLRLLRVRGHGRGGTGSGRLGKGVGHEGPRPCRSPAKQAADRDQILREKVGVLRGEFD